MNLSKKKFALFSLIACTVICSAFSEAAEAVENNVQSEISVSAESIVGDTPYTVQIYVQIDNYDDEKSYMISIDGGSSWRSMTDSEILFPQLISGTYEVVVKNAADSSDISRVQSIKTITNVSKESAYIQTEAILQYPELPTGCEITSLTMALRFCGYNVTKTDLADNYLEKGDYRSSDFNKVFVGNPRQDNAYGCYNEVIVRCAENYLSSLAEPQHKAVNLTGCDPALLYQCVADSTPVVVWATSDMSEPRAGRTWIDISTGKTVTWISGEHCLLLTGYSYSEGKVYFNDPLNGAVSYDMTLFEERFTQLGKQAVIITPID
ncbi:MAG: C39 family peptidase [Oscillospiraceae bacterium]|nr:C39 family peptidase [Oscillospiraceae bacterium]